MVGTIQRITIRGWSCHGPLEVTPERVCQLCAAMQLSTICTLLPSSALAHSKRHSRSRAIMLPDQANVLLRE